nr:MAG TPA: hypothetical protein [Caudoviricetes sp.]DAH84473.1 MAG TPA: hypothetical protein [Caudoviricetes sp.]
MDHLGNGDTVRTRSRRFESIPKTPIFPDILSVCVLSLSR